MSSSPLLDDATIELFHERAAIAEYDGKLSRLEAEKLAYFECKRRGVVPEEVKAICRATVERGIA